MDIVGGERDLLETASSIPSKIAPADMCIYCGRTNDRLTDEHIIPLALNGKCLIPNASCPVCQEKINQAIESPLLNGTLRPHRAKHGYRSRKNNKSNLLSEMTWEIKIQQSTVPFEIIVHKNIRDVPIPEFIFNLRWPPFLSVKTVPFSFGKLGDLTRFSTDTPNGRKLHNRIRQKYVRSGVRATIQYTSPKMKSGTFQLLLAKIACGFFYTARRDDFQASGLGLRLSERMYQPETRNFAPELQEVYSCPNEMFNLRVNEAARVCTICDVDGLHHYCMIKVLPEVFENTYFFRIPASVDTNEITSFSNDGTYRAWDGCLK